MPELQTIVKSLCSFSVIPGIFMLAMGLGVAPVDEGLTNVAAPFLDPLGLPFRPFVLVLGGCKIVGVLSLWGRGPMPEAVGRVGLATSAMCAAYGHRSVGESVVAPVVYTAMIGALYALDGASGKGKSA